MLYRKTQRLSYLISLLVHILFAVLFIAWTVEIERENDEFVTIGFGTFGKVSSSGAVGKKVEKAKTPATVEKQKVEAKKEEKKVELPEVKNTDEENPVVAAKEKEEKETPPEKVEPIVEKSESENKGREATGEGTGNFGFEIDFGGKGIRKIYSYKLPSYPSGVSKEIDVKLRFTILPDGTVGRIFPLIKADTRLELAAINSLRQWRFEPLPDNQKQLEQTAVIVFPYRLR